MKIWKRNAVVATVLVLICAGVYLNWEANQMPAVDLMQTLNSEQILDETSMVLSESAQVSEPVSADVQLSAADHFSQIRLTRQETRDGAVELLQETMAYEDGSETAAHASAALDSIVTMALAESQIESLIIAKGYEDCVAYMGEDAISVAVSAPETGLAQEDVALISDIITTQTDYTIGEIRIIEVK